MLDSILDAPRYSTLEEAYKYYRELGFSVREVIFKKDFKQIRIEPPDPQYAQLQPLISAEDRKKYWERKRLAEIKKAEESKSKGRHGFSSVQG
jgi:hypothetical protein